MTGAGRHGRTLSAVAGAAGLLVLAWAIRIAGVGSIADGFRRLGAGVVVVLLLGGVRHAARTIAWILCFDGERRPSIARAFWVYVAGDAIGNVTPFGALASEPSKIVLFRSQVATTEAIAALTLENLFYGGSVVLMLIAGTAALLGAFSVSSPIRTAAAAVAVAAVVATAAAAFVLLTRRPLISGAARALGRNPGWACDIERRVFGFAAAHRRRLLPIALLEAAYHIAAVAEVWFVLLAIAPASAGLLTAFILEYVNRTITVVFQFVPLWVGVDEAGTGLLTTALGAGAATGVTLALVRKARIAAWTAGGLAAAAVMRLASTNVRSRAPEWQVPARPAR